MDFYVYILRCKGGSYYVGHTDNLEKRLAEHQLGTFSGYTRIRRPVELLFAEPFASRQEAFERERQVKGWSRRKKEALIRREWEALGNAGRDAEQLVSRNGAPAAEAHPLHPSTSSG